MSDLLVDVSVPSRIVYREYRGKVDRNHRVHRDAKVSIAAPSVQEAPPAFRIEPTVGRPFEVLSYGHHYWWPVYDRLYGPKDVKTFLAELASGSYLSISILNPGLLYYGGHNSTAKDFSAHHPQAKIVSDNHDGNLVEIQRGASLIMLCADTLYFRGSAPVYFGTGGDATADRSLSLKAGPICEGKEPWLAGANRAERQRAILDGNIFHPNYLTDEAYTTKSRNLPVKAQDSIKHLRAVTERDPLDFYLDAAVRAVFNASPVALNTHRERIPQGWSVDATSRVPSRIGREILQDVLASDRYRDDLRLAEPLARADYILHRIDSQMILAPEDEEAMASLALSQ